MFHIIKATIIDIDKICSIGAQTFTDAYASNNTKEDLETYINKSFAPATILSELETVGTSYYLCFDDELLIGYLKLNFNAECEAFQASNVMELQRIYVIKEFYKRKAGAHMMQFAINKGISLNYNYIWLGVWKENHRALPFYFRWGFETIGERLFQVGNKVYDDYYLRLNLSQIRS